MTLEEYISAIRAMAMDEGIFAHETYWAPDVWQKRFENGLNPSEAWDHERHPALGAL